MLWNVCRTIISVFRGRGDPSVHDWDDSNKKKTCSHWQIFQLSGIKLIEKFLKPFLFAIQWLIYLQNNTMSRYILHSKWYQCLQVFVLTTSLVRNIFRIVVCKLHATFSELHITVSPKMLPSIATLTQFCATREVAFHVIFFPYRFDFGLTG